ncbi:MAG: hypothetical protein ACJARG_000051 [Arcticibacterium sp.]|jgi:hypothetical protein
MTKKEANSKVVKLFNKWRGNFRSQEKVDDTEKYYKDVENFKAECKQVHDVVGLYEVLTDKNALKMASICSSLRFVPPYLMLMQLQKTTKTY